MRSHIYICVTILKDLIIYTLLAIIQAVQQNNFIMFNNLILLSSAQRKLKTLSPSKYIDPNTSLIQKLLNKIIKFHKYLWGS